LKIDGTTMPPATMTGLTVGDNIDLASVGFDSAGTTAFESGNLLNINENNQSYYLQLDPSDNLSTKFFRLSGDGSGGTEITVVATLTYSTISDPSAIYGGTVPFAMNNVGQIAGHYYDSNGDIHGFIYSDGNYVSLPDAPAGGTQPLRVNDFGQVVGYSYGGGFTYSGGANRTYALITNPLLSDATYVPYGINDVGQVVGNEWLKIPMHWESMVQVS
jgi:hypothetical protein